MYISFRYSNGEYEIKDSFWNTNTTGSTWKVWNQTVPFQVVYHLENVITENRKTQASFVNKFTQSCDSPTEL